MADQVMNLTEHLEELRKRLMIIFVSFMIAFAASFLYVRDLYRFFAGDVPVEQLIILGPSDVIWVYFMIAGIAAIAICIPIASWQLWKYVRPALHPREQHAALIYIPVLTFLFVLGLAFGYFIIFPMVLVFLENLAQSEFALMYTAEKYFRFMVHMTVPFGFLFEMPAVVMFLTRLGVLNPERLVRMRKTAYFVLVIIAVMITPPDIVSDILVIVPLLLLYEISVGLSRIVRRKQSRLSTRARPEEG